MRFVARQPVFDIAMQVFGYELLFRNGSENVAQIDDSDQASRMTLDTLLEMGIDTLCSDHRAFLNCTRENLVSGIVELLPSASVVVELLETIQADAEVMAACQRLKQAGYLIALDDVVSEAAVEPLLPFADFVKVDFRLTKPAQRAELARHFLRRGISAVAEKVETRSEHTAAKNMGYSYFQGFFFQKPEMMGAREIPALKLNYVRLLSAAQQPEVDFSQIEEIIKTEPSLTYRLLRYLNSPLFPFSIAITSIRHALTLLGQEELRKWVSVASLVSIGVDKPEELIRWALVRARFCELLGGDVRSRQTGMFLLGLLSSLPVLLDLPLDFIVSRLPVLSEIKGALLGGRNRYRTVYELVLAYEAGEWETCSARIKDLRLTESQVSQTYLKSLEWACAVTRSTETAAPAAATTSA